jgi:hypothetical protein
VSAPATSVTSQLDSIIILLGIIAGTVIVIALLLGAHRRGR